MRTEYYCEFCGALMGVMSHEAYIAAHRHCDSVTCVFGCVHCADDNDGVASPFSNGQAELLEAQ